MVFDYRDPIFSIIAFFFLIFAVSFITYTYSLYREKKTRKEYRKLLKRFELGKLKEDDYIKLYSTYNLPFDSIMLLASTFMYKGEYNRAINVYLSLFEHLKDNVKKEELLEMLGTAYLKSGFLQRSKDVFLKVLKFSPKNKIALDSLLIIYEKLNEFSNMLDILEVKDALGIDIEKDKRYVEILSIINSSTIPFEKRSIELEKLLSEDKDLNRLIASFWLNFDKSFFWKNINRFDVINLIDLLWYIDKNDIDIDIVKNNKILSEIYTAKGYFNFAKESSIFELDILIQVKDKADLSFEFLCTSCKNVHPIFLNRCNICNNILSLKVQVDLVKKVKYEENKSFQ